MSLYSLWPILIHLPCLSLESPAYFSQSIEKYTVQSAAALEYMTHTL